MDIQNDFILFVFVAAVAATVIGNGAILLFAARWEAKQIGNAFPRTPHAPTPRPAV